jgi:hypothetical protein
LAQKGLIFLTNPVPGRLSLPTNMLSLGVHGAEMAGSSSVGSITSHTLVFLNVSFELAVDAFRVRRTGSSSSAGGGGSGSSGLSGSSSASGVDALGAGRPRQTLQVSERLRRAVLEPIVPVVYQQQSTLANKGASLTL